MLTQSSVPMKDNLSKLLSTVGDMALKRRAIRILEELELFDQEEILEIGCGNGYYLSLLNRMGKNKLTGVDTDKVALNNGRRYINNTKVKLINAPAENLPFKDKEFDKTICIEVLEYLSNPEKTLKELVRVSKNEVIISCANFNWYRINSFLSKEMREQYKEQIESNGNFINSGFFKKLAGKNNLKLKIIYISNRFEFVRNLFGNFFASEVIGIFSP